jgi:hypothetical protein
MKKLNLIHSRFDCILIWGHGIKYLKDILKDIRENENFEILKIQRHNPKSIKSFVKQMYSYDYAPFWHLKNKTKYLLKSSNEVCFIFIKNLNPNEDYLDEGDFRHKESLSLKKFKEELRDKYNPYENLIRSHNHVIHATDSESQTEHMLNYLGYNEGVSLFEAENNFIDAPYYLKGYFNLLFQEISVDDLYCNIIEGDSWNKYNTKKVKVEESPQFIGLTRNMNIYKLYVDKFIGGPLQEDYNLDRYKKISSGFEYLKSPYETSFILVEKMNDKYLILDGLHRACSHMKNGNKKIKVCQLVK